MYPLGTISDDGVRLAKQARDVAQNRFDHADPGAEYEAALLELSAADIRYRDAIRKAKGRITDDRQTA